MKKRLLKKIDIANKKATERIINSEPLLYDLRRAIETVPGMGKRMILHAGPPIKWKDMTGALQGAITGAILFEGWAKSINESKEMAKNGLIRLDLLKLKKT